MLLGSILSVAAAQSSGTPKLKVKDYTPKLPENLCGECIIDLNTINPNDGDFD